MHCEREGRDRRGWVGGGEGRSRKIERGEKDKEVYKVGGESNNNNNNYDYNDDKRKNNNNNMKNYGGGGDWRKTFFFLLHLIQNID